MLKAIKKLKKYLIDSSREMKKVTWPTKKQTKNYTIIVIALSLGIMIFFAILDYLFDIILKTII
ncbi:MAG: preprotein translocase subunit SecE [Candidatus Magasanikbacteria bacterium]|nr:preprotein translocase subunit SecE [Candidatus Magasanikbacteria bacterium]